MGAPYCQVVHELLVDAYGVTGQLWPGELPPPVAADAASVSTGFAAALATVLPSGGEGTPGGGLGFGTPGGAAAASPAPNGLNGLNGEKATPGTPGTPVADQGVAAAKAFEHELPMNAGMVNAPEVRGAAVPFFGAFGSARSLCALLGAAARGDLAPAGALDSADGGVEASALFGERRWGLGLQWYACAGGGERAVVGLHSFGGAMAFYAPREKVAVALLMNDCQLEYSTTRRVLNLISRELHIGKVEFVEGGLF